MYYIKQFFLTSISNRGKLLLLFLYLFLLCAGLQAQVFKTTNQPLYDFYGFVYTQEIPIQVSGLPEIIDTSYGFERITLTIHHTRTSDLKIQLQSPDGTTVWITNRNGGLSGQNYMHTIFEQYGNNGLINAASAPFSGTYIPDGQISFFNNGQNPNGIWKLLVEDLRTEEIGYLDSVSIYFGKKPAHISPVKKCSFENPDLCETLQNTQALLPDLVIVPYFTKTQIQEMPYNDSVFPRQLKVAVAIANIGLGPLEITPEKNFKDTCCSESKTSIQTGKRYAILQTVYSKRNNQLIPRNFKAGTIYYEAMPGHQHYHVDNWVAMRLVQIRNGKKQVICESSKISYCLFTTGMLLSTDSSSLINHKFYGQQMPNYGLGRYNACNLAKQGIAVGGYDYYGMLYEGQYIQLPSHIKNGNYILEVEVDPKHLYRESNKKNNVFSMPITLSKQTN